jgi:transcriptional regulator with XRE-family HTH domain
MMNQAKENARPRTPASPEGTHSCCGRHPWTHWVRREAIDRGIAYDTAKTCEKCLLTNAPRDPGPMLRAAGVEPSTVPGARPCCGRSILAQLTIWEARKLDRPPGTIDICKWCMLTDIPREDLPVLEEWYLQLVKRFQEDRNVAPARTKAGGFVARNRGEFEAVVRARIRFARQYRGFNQEELAGELGLHRDSLAAIEIGKRQRGGMLHSYLDGWELYHASRVLGCALAWLVGESEDPGWFEPDLSPMLGFAEYLKREERTSDGCGAAGSTGGS